MNFEFCRKKKEPLFIFIKNEKEYDKRNEKR